MQYPTHEVINQPPPLEGHNAFTLDLALGEALAREGAAWAADSLLELGKLAGTAEAIEWGRLANVNPPVLHTHDRFGHRLDRIDFHPLYHELMRIAIANGLNAAPWADSRPGSHVVRGAKFIVWTSVEAGHLCPMSMTRSKFSMSWRLLYPRESKAPHLMRLSTTRLLILRRSTREQKSRNDLNDPSLSLDSMMDSIALSPTFFTAASPKRMFPPSTLKSRTDWLMSGGRTLIPMSLQTLMCLMTLSRFPFSLVSSAAMNSTG